MDHRAVVTARRQVADRVAAAFLPFERSAQETAMHGALTVAAVLTAHTEAALPPSAGREAVVLLTDAARYAALARDAAVQAHDLLRALPAEHNLTTASGAECPDGFAPPIGALHVVAA